MSADGPPPGEEDDQSAFAEGAITLWSNLLAMIGAEMLDRGMPRADILEMLSTLHRANEETVRSPRARAIAARHLMAVYRALGEG